MNIPRQHTRQVGNEQMSEQITHKAQDDPFEFPRREYFFSFLFITICPKLGLLSEPGIIILENK